MKFHPIGWPLRSLFLPLCLLGGGLISVALKQDANWDLMNYHIYNPWALLHNRADVDLFAAGIQSYFNPVLDLPYYFFAFVWLNDKPRTVAFLMGLPYGLIVFFAIRSAHLVLVDLEVSSSARPVLAILLVAFGATGAATFPQIGTTFNEIPVSAIVLGGVTVLLAGLGRAGQPILPRSTFWAGMLFGLAAGLKLTASIYAPGAVLALFALAASKRRVMMPLTLFCLAWMLGFCISYGWWAWHLYHATGNPLFPMFENVFRTHWLGSANWMENRFKPHGFLPAMFYPFYWIDTISATIAEPIFSDPRFAAALTAFMALAVALPLSLIGSAIEPGKRAVAVKIPASSLFVIVFSAISYAIWLFMFSVLRYAVSLEVLLGLTIGICLILCPRFFGSTISPSALIAFSMLLLFCVATKTKYPVWGRADYGKVVLEVQPVALARDSLVIVLGPPQAYVLPSLAKQNPGVQFAGIDDALLNARAFGMWHQVRQKIADARGEIYAMARLDALPRLRLLPELDLAIDEHSCKNFSTNIDAGFRICRVIMSRVGSVDARP